MGHEVVGMTGRYAHVIHETFDEVEVILDQAFADAPGSRFELRQGLSDPSDNGAPVRPLPPRF